MISSVVKNSWTWNFADFRDLVLILPEAATRSVLWKKMFLRIFQYSWKHLCQSLFLSWNSIWHMGFSVNFVRYHWLTASALQKLLALYFAIIYRWQLSSSKKSLVGKKTFIHIFQKFCRFRFLLRTYFFHLDKCLFPLSVTQSVCCTLSSQWFCWLRDT